MAGEAPTVNGGRVVDVLGPEKSSETNEESLSDFFGPEVTKKGGIPKCPISDRAMEALKSTTVAEVELRDAVFADFVDEH